MKYLRLIPALLLGAALTACNTTKKLYEAQEYDQVIQRLAPDICDGDMNASRINMVAASYHKANQADHECIQALKATGQPDVWPEIYQRYCSMKGRNDALACFPTQVKNGMNYVKLDLDEDSFVLVMLCLSVLAMQAISLCHGNLRRMCLLLMQVNCQPIILFLQNGIENFLSCIQLMLWWMR